MAKWIWKNNNSEKASKLAIETGLTEMMTQLLINKGYDTTDKIVKFVNAGLKDFISPSLLHGIDDAADLIIKRISEKKKFRIIGDYDVDGITSTSIMVKGLIACGADVDYDIPERKKDGYGLNIRLIDEAVKDNIDVIITVDNGIAAVESIKKAKESGIEVIVTDHHEVGFTKDSSGNKMYIYPDADIIIDPKTSEYDYEFRDICGAMVALKLITRVFSRMGKTSRDIDELVELAALGTVCDVMDLISENRGIVKGGLRKMNASKNKGIKALIKEYELEGKTISCYHLGFIIGPAINSSGRIGNPKTGVELLLADTDEKALQYAQELKRLNEERKTLTEQGVKDAVDYIENGSYDKDDIIVVYLPDSEESVAGIIAGRLKEKYNHPVFVFTDSEKENIIKGSGRSIDSYNMFEHLNEVSKYLTSFGGHKGAAGLSLSKDNLENFRKAINENSGLEKSDFEVILPIDIRLPLHMITEKFINELNLFEPCGQGNKRPIIADKNVSIKRIAIVGKDKNVLKLSMVSDRNQNMQGVYFGDIEDFNGIIIKKYGEDELKKAYAGMTNECVVDVAYTPEINEWNNMRSIEIRVNCIC